MTNWDLSQECNSGSIEENESSDLLHYRKKGKNHMIISTAIKEKKHLRKSNIHL